MSEATPTTHEEQEPTVVHKLSRKARVRLSLLAFYVREFVTDDKLKMRKWATDLGERGRWECGTSACMAGHGANGVIPGLRFEFESTNLEGSDGHPNESELNDPRNYYITYTDSSGTKSSLESGALEDAFGVTKKQAEWLFREWLCLGRRATLARFDSFLVAGGDMRAAERVDFKKWIRVEIADRQRALNAEQRTLAASKDIVGSMSRTIERLERSNSHDIREGRL